MTYGVFDKSREKFLGGDLDWDAHTFKAVLIDEADYTVNLATHDFLDDVPSGARVGTPQTLGSKTKTNGVADAADVTFPSVTGDPSEAILIYRDTGTEATSEVIAYLGSDTPGGTGLPVTPNGGNIAVTWHANGIFKL